MSENFKIDLSEFKASIKSKLAAEPARRRKVLFEVASFAAAEAKKRAPVKEGFLTSDITAKVEQDGTLLGAVICISANAASASYAIQMHEGPYQLGKLSQAKQARVSVTVGPRFITRALDENLEKIRKLIIQGLIL